MGWFTKKKVEPEVKEEIKEFTLDICDGEGHVHTIPRVAFTTVYGSGELDILSKTQERRAIFKVWRWCKTKDEA